MRTRGVAQGARAPGVACVLVVALALSALAACGREPRYDRDDLPTIVLNKRDAPAGTVFVDNSSGYQNLDEYAEDKTERDAMERAGFVTAYFAQFLSPGLFRGEKEPLNPNGSLAVSFAVMFRDADSAGRGLNVVEEEVRKDGADLTQRSTQGFPQEAFAYAGTLDQTLPPGFMFAWRQGNVVLGLVASGAPGAIDEGAARRLAELMRSRA